MIHHPVSAMMAEIIHSEDYPDLLDEEGNPLEPGYYYVVTEDGEWDEDSYRSGPFETDDEAEEAFLDGDDGLTAV